ncbi:MAG: FeoB small GTPase domain-containing protein, partial [Polaromonas sp.]|nr:FeoB small GTPase domain-containing protein [Polaromonas sp.]
MSSADPTPMPRIALVGNPNCGKTALFNLLTGACQKVANYAGVTVERKEGRTRLPDGRELAVMDLPGAYSLNPATADETVTHDVLMGLRAGEERPDGIIAVVDATNLRMNLRLVLQLRALGRPMVLALNMMDVARARGLQIDIPRLSAELGMPVIKTVAVHNPWFAAWRGKGAGSGRDALLQAAQQAFYSDHKTFVPPAHVPHGPSAINPIAPDTAALQAQVRAILAAAVPNAGQVQRFNHRIDALVMHPVAGLLLLATVLFLIFQAVFAWANLPMDVIKDAVAWTGSLIQDHMAPGLLQ